jgi:hypothetical protein
LAIPDKRPTETRPKSPIPTEPIKKQVDSLADKRPLEMRPKSPIPNEPFKKKPIESLALRPTDTIPKSPVPNTLPKPIDLPKQKVPPEPISSPVNPLKDGIFSIFPFSYSAKCPICDETFPTEYAYGQHIDDAHGVGSMPPPATRQIELESPVKPQKQFSRLRKSNTTFEWGEKRRTKDGVVYYKSFNKGGDHYGLGDFVEIEKESGFYVGKISDMWEDDENLHTRCKVYYMPEATHSGRTKGREKNILHILNISRNG